MSESRPPAADVREQTNCIICGARLFCRWTDTHGVGACTNCGVPYRLYHYEGPDGNKQRVDKPPECTMNPPWLPLHQRYWQATGRNVCPGAYNFPGSTYEVATQEDMDNKNDWMKAHEDEWPAND